MRKVKFIKTRRELMMKLITGVFIILFSQACNLFEKDEIVLAEHKRSNGERVKIYYVGLGATTRDVIQVRKANEEKLLWVTDKYNYIKSSKLIDDTSLQIVLSDTGYQNYNNKLDTIIINVK
ncbi:MAG TPA: hypothetical protein VFU29_24150 [Chitinophagaceae bacterium]|nr:hypothetical protein [Chitinophagaceae bacterium]